MELQGTVMMRIGFFFFFGLAPLESCRDFQRERESEVLMLQQKLVMEV